MSYRQVMKQRTENALICLGYSKEKADKYARLYVKELFNS